MIIVMKKQASDVAINHVVALIQGRGLTEHVSRGIECTIIGAVGDERVFDPKEFECLPEVERAMRVLHDWRMISREVRPDNTLIQVRGVTFGQEAPLYVSSEVANQDADGVYLDPYCISLKPYAEPQSAAKQKQTMVAQIEAVHAQGKPALVRLRDVRQLDAVLQAQADVLYLGGELMENVFLQNEVGCLNTPVVLCKDKHHPVAAWLKAAERIMLQGNHYVMLGEAGTLSVNDLSNYRLDIEAIAVAKNVSHLPVVANVTQLAQKYLPESLLKSWATMAGASVVIGS
ncbi:MAG: chorismate mutase [Neisseriaceae bacterium]|nr:chorismate mutase [Neisseriaceae bacterium]